MRSVEKGPAPNVYSGHRAARNDMIRSIGLYCSYCEMPVRNMIEIEHVIPVANGGPELDWNNFLFSCRYCNGVKRDRNIDRNGYLWPDEDNTSEVFLYSELDVIEPKLVLPKSISVLAEATIELTGLNRRPGGKTEPTDADTRHINRDETWRIAWHSLDDWNDLPEPQMARQIARTASGHGFYSIWKKVFFGVTSVLDELDKVFPGTYLPTYIHGGPHPDLRPGGRY